MAADGGRAARGGRASAALVRCGVLHGVLDAVSHKIATRYALVLSAALPGKLDWQLVRAQAPRQNFV